jgi:hypothetical protein
MMVGTSAPEVRLVILAAGVETRLFRVFRDQIDEMRFTALVLFDIVESSRPRHRRTRPRRGAGFL